MDRRVASTAAAFALALAVLPASLLLTASPSAAGPPATVGQSSIDGTISVSIISSTLKHWGVPEAEAAFVPDADSSAPARAIRAAADTAALCAAFDQAAGKDKAIAIAHADGDGNLEHRSGDEARLGFRIVVPAAAAAAAGPITAGASTISGRVYVCSRPVVAIVSRGAYPDERFEHVEGHRLSWTSRAIAVRPGEHAHVHLSASIDASQW